MTVFGLSESDLKYIIDILSRYPHVTEALIFGSRAKGNYKNVSDIDLALKGKDLEKDVLEIHGKLNDESPLPYQIDVVAYDTITHVNLKDHINRVGIRIYPA